MKDLSYEERLSEERNEARKFFGIEQIPVKTRKCNCCSEEFKSSEYRSCVKCRNKKLKFLKKGIELLDGINW
jgi:hypothetical protein